MTFNRGKEELSRAPAGVNPHQDLLDGLGTGGSILTLGPRKLGNVGGFGGVERGIGGGMSFAVHSTYSAQLS